MEEKTKKLLLLLGAFFVAVIFLTSYASFGNNSMLTTTATTTIIERSFPAFGNSTATVTGYGGAARVSVAANDVTASNAVSNLLSGLEANSTINYVGSNSSYEVYSSKIDAYSLQGLLLGAVNQSNSITVTATAEIMLPKNVTLYYNTYPINVYLSNRNYSVNMTSLKPVNSVVNVKVIALVTNNGTIYNNQLTVSLIP
jgi:hypothetical protein